MNFVYQTLADMYDEFFEQALEIEMLEGTNMQEQVDPNIDKLLELLKIRSDVSHSEYTSEDMLQIFLALSEHYTKAAFELGSEKPARIP